MAGDRELVSGVNGGCGDRGATVRARAGVGHGGCTDRSASSGRRRAWRGASGRAGAHGGGRQGAAARMAERGGARSGYQVGLAEGMPGLGLTEPSVTGPV